MEDKSIIIVPEKVSWNDERVLTTAQLAEFYETSTDNIWQNFKRNRDRFVDGKHFFKLEGDDLEKLRLTICQEQISSMARTAYLWTKRGAARHAKMLNTDKAWEVFEALEDNYFDRPAIAPDKTTSESAFERDKLAFEREKLAVEREKFAIGRELLAFERDKLAFERDKLAVGRELIAVERDKLAAERKKFNAENSQEAKIFEAVHNIVELAKLAGDEKSVRSKLVRIAANLLTDKIY